MFSSCFRDALIVTSLDTLTSFIAGCTIFGILGNLAHEMGMEDINNVVKSGAGLAFISYPDAIAKFTFVPQVNINEYIVKQVLINKYILQLVRTCIDLETTKNPSSRSFPSFYFLVVFFHSLLFDVFD